MWGHTDVKHLKLKFKN